MERSKPPPATAGRPVTAKGDGVEVSGSPVGPDEDSDWSKADTLDRQG
jgi:hypothetical protein